MMSETKDTVLQQNLKLYLQATKRSGREVSVAAGLGETGVKAILAGKSRNPRGDTLSGLAKVIGVRVDDLLERPLDLTALEATPPEPLPPSNVRPAPDFPELPVRGSMPRDVPVYGTAQGGEDGAFELNYFGEAIDYVRRPPGLAGNNRVFAIYVEGESMAPWREPGQAVYVHSVQPANVGDYVVVVVPQEEPGRPPMAYIKRLVKRTASQVIVSQYNPPKELTFPRHEGVKVLRVIDWDEALGIR